MSSGDKKLARDSGIFSVVAVKSIAKSRTVALTGLQHHRVPVQMSPAVVRVSSLHGNRRMMPYDSARITKTTKSDENPLFRGTDLTNAVRIVSGISAGVSYRQLPPMICYMAPSEKLSDREFPKTVSRIFTKESKDLAAVTKMPSNEAEEIPLPAVAPNQLSEKKPAESPHREEGDSDNLSDVTVLIPSSVKKKCVGPGVAKRFANHVEKAKSCSSDSPTSTPSSTRSFSSGDQEPVGVRTRSQQRQLREGSTELDKKKFVSISDRAVSSNSQNFYAQHHWKKILLQTFMRQRLGDCAEWEHVKWKSQSTSFKTEDRCTTARSVTSLDENCEVEVINEGRSKPAEAKRKLPMRYDSPRKRRALVIQ